MILFKNKTLLFVIYIFLATSLFLSTFHFSLGVAKAQEIPTAPFTASFIDRSNIEITGSNGVSTVITDTRWDTNWNYKGSFGGSCEVELKGFERNLRVGYGKGWGPDKVNVDLKVEVNTGTGCTEVFNDKVQIRNPDKARAAFEWESSDTIVRVDNDNNWTFVLLGEEFQPNPGERWFTRTSEASASSCRDTIVVDSSGNMILYEMGSGNEVSNTVSPIAPDCNLVHSADENGEFANSNQDSRHRIVPSNVTLPLSDPVSDDGSQASDAAATGGSGSSSEDQPNCTNGGGELSWIVCPLLGYADDVISYLDNQVNTLLQVPESYYSDSTIEEIWQRMRDVAYLLLIPTLLIMVIGTALGFQFLDAYTVKRALPRLFVAVIFIAISLPLLRFLIGSINVIGQGVYGLITSVVDPEFEFSLQGLFDPSFGQEAAVTLALGGAVITAKIWIVAGLFLAFSVFLSIATIFLLLAFRQLLIVALIIIAPLAILAWIFPGNDKPWKLWWATFWKLLVLYPLIMGLLAIGRVFAFVVDGVSPGGLVEVVLKLVAYIGPFFLIPSAFKYAGGVFANIGGIVNNKEKGAFDRLRKGRQQSLGKKTNQFLKGDLEGRGVNTLNRVGRNLGVGSKGRFGIGERGRQARDLYSQANSDEALKNSPALQKLAFNDDANAVMALAGGSRRGAEQAARDLFTDASGNYDEARANRAIEAAAAVGFSSSNSQAALNTLAQNKARSVATGAAGRDQINRGIARLTDNPQIADSVRQSFAYNANGKRNDLAHTNWQSTSATGINTASLEGFGRGSLYQAGQADPRSVSAATADAINLLSTGDQNDRLEAAKHYAELETLRNSGSTAAIRDTATRNMVEMEANGIKQMMKTADSGRIDPLTGLQATVTEQIRYDSLRGSTDPAYRATFTAAERSQGYKEQQRAEKLGEQARRESRAYEVQNPSER